MRSIPSWEASDEIKKFVLPRDPEGLRHWQEKSQPDDALSPDEILMRSIPS